MFIDFSIALLSSFYFVFPYPFFRFDIAKLEKVIKVLFVSKGVEVLAFYFLNAILRQTVAEFLSIFPKDNIMLTGTGEMLKKRAETGSRLNHEIYLGTTFCFYGSFFISSGDGLLAIGKIKEMINYWLSFVAFGGNVDVSHSLVLTAQATKDMEFGLGKFGLKMFNDLPRDLFSFYQRDSLVLVDETQGIFEN